jgi:hypothetical protein
MQCGSVFAQLRVWEDSKGNRFEGQYVGVLYDSVELENARGENRFIPLNELSDRDKIFLDKVYIPQIEIHFSKSTRNKVRTINALPDDHVVVVVGTVVFKELSKISCDSLQAEVCLIGKEVATDDYRLMNRIISPIKLTAENDYTYQFKIETESRDYREYNDQKRGTEYIGYVVAIRKQGEDRAIRFLSNIEWMQADQLKAIDQLRVSSFFDKDCQQISVPRPIYSTKRVGIQ